mmetsp:Transcript_19969/g.33658  ORF Transcript_19969/g.33658 Transcript_19969/m.33658 type:complete len:209 (+) Transcript_19969:112-738(+)|eukprot:CAMPEP_0114475276 /NCGR_PEP_ID=MMETSP0104-20121206/14049_1 /TAXON_ID=37642 ORGANISM="Paraphysomonas imperforata, Strain PA2" /NCGR_SAMPLE_ID=MMETSP0104 /ASSEMBLY_ACC=CAM_ASM_000202 /LENGTH=208 /DNA_ID=CAMNT_0001649757 /DNA_START=112 /DNA_END=738 /DNA_ORIENTATION=+
MFAEGSVEVLYIEVTLLDDRSGQGKDEMTAFLETQTSDNITEVKEKILAEMSLGLLTDNYKLFYNDVMLTDDAYLIDYNVQDFDSLTMKCYSTGRAIGLTQSNIGGTDTNSIASRSESGGGATAKTGGAIRKMAGSGGRRGLYEDDTVLPATLSEKDTHGDDFDPSLQLGSIFKDIVKQISSVGLCCLRSGDADDEYYDDRRGGVDAF